MWVACRTDQEIADALKVERSTISKLSESFVNSVLENQNHKAAADHAVDFEVPVYNVWRQREKTPGPGIFGNSEVRWVNVENRLRTIVKC